MSYEYFDKELALKVKVLRDMGLMFKDIANKLNIKPQLAQTLSIYAKEFIKYPFECEIRPESTTILKYMRKHGLRDLTPMNK